MIEDILSKIGTLTPFWIYAALFFFSYIENVFPPSPSDLVVVVGGSLIARPDIGVYFIPTLILTSVGSVLGFMTLFFLGSQLDKKVIRAGKIKFISIEALEKAEQWFIKYGYYVILINRFLPGTRSVISFFAGLSELNIKKTVILATVSALVWNAIMLYIGSLFGNNIEKIDYYLSTYSNIVIAVTGIAAAIVIIRYFLTKKKKT
ncbi:MAG: DedA family protein [Ignavibacteriaceae bacterium]